MSSEAANPVLEVVLFRLKPGVDPAEFLEAAQATFDFLTTFPGYLDRELSVSEDGQWIDIVHWRDMSAALAAADQFMSHPVAQAFGALLDPDGMTMHHLVPRITASA